MKHDRWTDNVELMGLPHWKVQESSAYQLKVCYCSDPLAGQIPLALFTKIHSQKSKGQNKSTQGSLTANLGQPALSSLSETVDKTDEIG